MIILEGSDRVGKTTVAAALQKLLPHYSYRHHTNPPVDSFAYFTWFLADAHPRVIVDRLHWSDYAYGKTYANGMALTPHQWRLVELALMSRGAYVLMMTDELESILKRWGADEMYSSGPLAQLLERYDELVEYRSDPRSYLINGRYRLPELVESDPGRGGDWLLSETLFSVACHAELLARSAANLLPPSLGIGSPSASFMVLGEAPGEHVYADDLSPRLPFKCGPASQWLWDAIDKVRLQWWDGYYTNASAFLGPQSFAEYVNRAVPVKAILCLGKKAHELVKGAHRGGWFDRNVSFLGIDHPAFARRFHYGKFDDWAGELKDALLEYCTA